MPARPVAPERRADQPNLAWFMGYYPSRAPRIAFCVLVDRTPAHGGEVCGPVARDAIQAFERRTAATESAK